MTDIYIFKYAVRTERSSSTLSQLHDNLGEEELYHVPSLKLCDISKRSVTMMVSGPQKVTECK